MGQTPFIKWEGLKTYCTAVHYSYMYNVGKVSAHLVDVGIYRLTQA